MLEDIRRANLILEQQGIAWRISLEEVIGVSPDVVVRNRFGQVLFRGYTVEGVIQWIIQQPVPQEDLDPYLGHEDDSMVELLLFVPISKWY